MTVLRKAHSTLESYAIFRGCNRLIARNENYAICKTDSDQVIKIVKFRNKWYLDGDLPKCLLNFCF